MCKYITRREPELKTLKTIMTLGVGVGGRAPVCREEKDKASQSSLSLSVHRMYLRAFLDV